MADQFPALDDFNDFSAPSGGQSDFLARERELLGDEFGPAPTNVPSATEFNDKPSSFPGLDDLSSPTSPGVSSNNAATGGHTRMSSDFLSSFGRDPPPPAKEPLRTASVAVENDEDEDDDLNKFQSQYPDIAPYPVVNTTSQPSQYQQNGYSSEPSVPPQSYSAAPSEPESDAIREWQEKQRVEIEERDQRSRDKKEEAIRKAEQAIDDFYASYNQKKERQIAKNKENEAAFKQARDDALGKGTTWERIADLIDLQDSRSKTAAKGTKDLSRMKEVLLNLKREGETAPGAAGY